MAYISSPLFLSMLNVFVLLGLPLVSGSGLCPTGVGFVGIGCGAGCPQNAICYQGRGCCPLATCPGGSVASAFCSPGCAGFCYQGCCCDGVPPHLGYGRGAVYPLPGLAGPGAFGGLLDFPQIVCPTGIPGLGPCGSGCGAGHLCYQGACCPLASCPGGMLAHSFCGSGHTCSSGGSCYQGCCCPLSPRPVPALPQLNYAPHPVQITCPTGVVSTTACAGGCGNGHLCHSGACCPLAQCPGGIVATGFCNSGGCDSGVCHSGCCCPPAAPAPYPGHSVHPGLPPHPAAHVAVNVVCPTGVPSTVVCGGGCGAGSLCYQGACCPLASCPTGNVASGFCADGSCAGGTCYNGCCCPMGGGPGIVPSIGAVPAIHHAVSVTCPTGFVSTTPCGGRCAEGHLCHSGACCPLAQCPGGRLASGFCAAGGGCSSGGNCYNGCCCPQGLPSYGPPLIPAPAPGPFVPFAPPAPVLQVTCPTGFISDIACGSGCVVGHGCFQGACCPFATCPGGAMSSAFCGLGGNCDGSCHQGCCCPPAPPLAPMVPPIAAVGPLNVCPYGGNMVPFHEPVNHACNVGFFPHNSGCCAAFSTRTITHTTTCSTGNVAFAHCSMAGSCPPGYQCQGTTCCQTTTTVTTTLSIPGAPCSAGGGLGCAGYASCREGACACNSGFASNGVSCVHSSPALMDFSPRPCLGGCRRRRQSKHSKGNDTNTETTFFPPLANVTRTCKDDCTCTPAELCIEGRCLPRLVPGQTGCEHDAQCKYDCAASFCNSTTQRCECHANQMVLPQLGLCCGFIKPNLPKGNSGTKWTVCFGNQHGVIAAQKCIWEYGSTFRDMRERLEAHTCGSGYNRECGTDGK